MFKKLTLIFTAVVLSLSLFVPTYASEIGSTTPTTSKMTIINNGDEVAPAFINDFRYRKKNVTKSTAWSSYARISDVAQANGSGGYISATVKKTYGVVVTGAISGLGFDTSITKSSAIGYTLNLDPYQRAYMGYRVKYSVEKGTREYYDITNGNVISSNSYTVKTPTMGEYKLINYTG